MAKIFFLLVVVLFLSVNFANSQNKPIGNITETRNISPTGQPNSVMNFGESAEISALVKKITEAKKTGSNESVQYYQNKLDALTGASKVECADVQFTEGTGGQTDVLNYHTVSVGHLRAAAVATDRMNGNIYVVTVSLNTPLKIEILKSVNNGLNFSIIGSFTLNLIDHYAENNQLDVEVLSRGDSTYIYGVLGLWTIDSSKAMYFRLRSDGNRFMSTVFAGTKRIANPGGVVESIRPRITSDNSAFPLLPYIYIMYTLDSLEGTGSKWMKSKVIRINNPYWSNPALVHLYTNFSYNGAYFYWANNQPDSAFMHNDICCVNSGDSNFVVTTTVMRGTTNIIFVGTKFYMTISPSFGNIISSTTVVNDSKLLTLPRIVSPGKNTRSVMMGALRLYGGGDWDPYYYKCDSLSRSFLSFTTSGYVDASSDTTMSFDLAAAHNSFDTYLFALNNMKATALPPSGDAWNGKILGNLYKGGTFTGLYQVNPPSFPVLSRMNYPSAAFRFVNNDSCFVGYGGKSFSNYFTNYGVTGGCSGAFIGIENNFSTANEFRLSQNYPNPFNPTTNIKFDMLKSGFVTIKLYNVLGKEIDILLSGYKTSGGYTISYNGNKLESGVYFYKMETEDFTEIKKMVLIK